MSKQNFDFSGWATKANIKCSDDRTILRNAFKHQDGARVPLVWMHRYDSPDNILGYAILEHRDEGVYAYCSCNDTEKGKLTKELVKHGDLDALSIFANHLNQDPSRNVLHGDIKELSVVIAGANPEAKIEEVIRHCEDNDNELFCINPYVSTVLYHADGDNDPADPADQKDPKDPDDPKDPKDPDDPKDPKDPDDPKDPKDPDDPKDPKDPDDPKDPKDPDDPKDPKDPEDPDGAIKHSDVNNQTVLDKFNSLDEDTKNLFYVMLGTIVENEEGNMAHNIFEGAQTEEYLSHAEQFELISEASKSRLSLRDLIADKINAGELKHSITDDDGNVIEYGIANMQYLFPEAKNLTNEPELIKRNQTWVAKVMNGVHHTPFSRVRSLFADITMDDARARGYIKGHRKIEEVIKVLRRKTEPKTIYKKQKLDRDDIVDITDFDVVMWLKREMRLMLDEEIARAILIGDGRSSIDESYIDPDKVRPIWTDDELFTIRMDAELTEDMTKEQQAEKIIDTAIEAMEDYEGSGSPVMFVDKWFYTRSKLIKNSIGERIYKTKQELIDTIGVDDIIPVPVMKNQTRTDSDNKDHKLVAIIVDLNDYNVGADKGGEINNFEDFDINFNQEIYLTETRISGALIRPKSAVALEMVFQ